MITPTDNSSVPDVTALAVRLKLISQSDADTLRGSSEKLGLPPLQAALQTGLLSVEAVDIVETLLRPRDAIPGYEIVDLLGHGGMGVVYRARQLALDRFVALKTILIGRMANADTVARFEQEAKTIAQLKHSNIVGAFDFGKHGGRLFLAMEFVDGSSADALVKRQGPLSETVVWGMIRQTAAGLAHAWSRRIVHRDIKPANLLLVEKPDGFPLPPGIPLVMIADFGLAQLSDMVGTNDRLTAENVTVGSPHYMAPEQLQSSDVDFRADMYALGATALHLLTGAPPLHHLTLPQLVTRKLAAESIAEEPEFRNRLSPTTYELVRCLTSRHPQDRPASYAALIAEIARLPAGTSAVEPKAALVGLLPTTTFPAVSASHSSQTATNEVQTVSSAFDQATVIRAFPVSSETNVVATNQRIVPLRRFAFAKSWKLWVPMAILLAIVLGAVFWPRTPTAHVPMRNVGQSQDVFNGSNLTTFRQIDGNWVVEDSRIEGTDGNLAHSVVRRGGDQGHLPLVHYRLEVLIDRHKAKAAWIEFAIAATNSGDGASWAVRLTGDQAELVSRSLPSEPWKSQQKRSLTNASSKTVIVFVERNPAGWFVSVGEKPLGSVPFSAQPEIPEFRLGAEGGPALFSDLVLTELEPITK